MCVMPTQVAIVMPCWNPDPVLLSEAVASVERQTHQQLTLVVVDDGSTEPAAAVAFGELRKRGHHVLHQANAGPASARNAGIAAVMADLVLPLDCDDLLSDDFVSSAVRAFDGRPDLTIAYSDVHRFGAYERTTTMPDALQLKDFFAVNPLVATAVFRREDWTRLGGYCTEHVHGLEDYEWWVRLLASGGLAIRIPDTLFHYRIRAGTRSDRQELQGDPMAATRDHLISAHPEMTSYLLRAGWEFADDVRSSIRPSFLGSAVKGWLRTHPGLMKGYRLLRRAIARK